MNPNSPDTTPEVDRSNLRRYVGLSLVFAICLIGTSLLLKSGTGLPVPVTWVISTLPLFAGGIAIWSFIRYVCKADELQRYIHINAIAFSWGIMIVTIISYPVLELVGAPKLQRESFALIGIAIYIGGVAYGNLRLR